MNTFLEKALKFLKKLQTPKGGFLCWLGSTQMYLEVTGYLIPTLLRNGMDLEAKKAGTWLKRQQRGNGAFTEHDGKSYLFNTCAVIEGLSLLGRTKPIVDKAKEWAIEKMRTQPQWYNVRSAFILQTGIEQWRGFEHWHPTWGMEMRSNHLAYGLEGMLAFGLNEEVETVVRKVLALPRFEGLLPWTIRERFQAGHSSCTIASAQFVILAHKVGITDRALADAVREQQQDDGGYHLHHGDARKAGWVSKYAIDMENALSG